jgi:hypothetical protein
MFAVYVSYAFLCVQYWDFSYIEQINFSSQERKSTLAVQVAYSIFKTLDIFKS